MNADTQFKNATIVTCDPDHTIVENAGLYVNEGKISWIGPSSELPEPLENTTIVDASGKILMPGLINMHAHCTDSLFRGLVENLPLEEWLQNVWKAQAIILRDPMNCRLGAYLGISELLLGGTTSVMDNYWNPDETIHAAKKAGIRLATGGIFFDAVGMDGTGPKERPQQATDLFEKHKGDSQLFIGTMPHGTYTANPDNLKTAIEIANRHNGFFSIHAAETKREQATIQERYQTSVIRLLNKVGGLSPRTVLAHCVHIDEEELDLIANSGSHVAHNPLSNLKLASGFAPVTKMQEKGINVTIGTDGAISGNDIDMWLAMKLAATIHKAANDNPSALSAHQVLHMATLNGAKALNATERLGSVDVGKEADLLLVDITGPHAVPMFDPVSHLVFSATKSDVSDVYIAGRHIVKNHQICTFNVEEKLAEVRALQPQISAALKG